MRAAIADNGTLVVREVPDPVAGEGELLVAVRAAGLNAADRMMLRGTYVVGTALGAGPAPAPDRRQPMGGEAAGEVVAIGTGVRRFAVGDRVMGMCRGGFAELVRMEEGRAMPVPAPLGWAEAGGAPVTLVTAHDALVTAGALTPGARVLVNAASSGVGVAALQLARLLGAGTTVAVSTSAAKLDALRSAGVTFDAGLVASDPQLVPACLEAAGGAGIDVAVDSVGGPSWPELLAVAALGGRIVSVGRLGGLTTTLDLDELARKRVSVVGVTFRTRTPAQAAAVVAAAAPDILPALGDGRLRVLVDRTFPLDAIGEADAYRRTNQHVGKIVVTP